MGKAIAADYEQQFLLPPAVEDWVGKDHPVRFLREFVDALDLGALGFAMPVEEEGRPGYHPNLLLKIWLYGYYHRVRSTRKLEVACREQLPLIWLSGMNQPDHNTLWRFWRENTVALRALYKQTVRVALEVGAVGLALQALDGTKIQAAASGHSGWSKERMEKLLGQLDAGVDEIEQDMNEGEDGAKEPVADTLPGELTGRAKLREEIEKGLAQLESEGRSHYHPKEPQARRMRTAEGNRFGYNAQAVADEKEGGNVAAEVGRKETDNGQLAPMITQARENLGNAAQDTLTVADSGYASGADLKAAAELEMRVLAPPLEGAPSHGNPYASSHFAYDASARRVSCPQGQTLDYEGSATKARHPFPVERYRCHHRDCPVRAQSTSDPKGRQMEIWPHTPAVQAMRARLKDPSAAALYKRRAAIIEPRFAQIKAHDAFRRWTAWGLEAARAQWAMLCATLNLRIIHKYWKRPLCPLPAVSQAQSSPGFATL